MSHSSEASYRAPVCRCGLATTSLSCPKCGANLLHLTDIEADSNIEQWLTISKWLNEVPIGAVPPWHVPWRSSLGIIIHREISDDGLEDGKEDEGKSQR
jgi:hypothetical protein